jgi:AcrR family transcriptional regulator
MPGRVQIVAELKRALRAAGHTYADVARQLGLSVASVKRLFSKGDFTLERLERVCELIGLGLSDVLENAASYTAPTEPLTLAQEKELVANPRLLFIAWLVLIRTPIEEIPRLYRFTAQHALIRLDRLKVIELLPANRVRLLISRQFSWRVGGPVHQYIHQKLLREFFESSFTGHQEEFVFFGCPVSIEALGRLKKVLQDASRECADIIDRDRSAGGARRGAAYVLALRPWSYSGFEQFERE